MVLEFLRRRRRAQRPESAESAESADSAVARSGASRVAAWSWLDAAGRDLLVADTDTLLRTLRWEAAQPFELTDEIRSTIAAHAALLTLELGLDCYRDVSSVIVHPSTIELRGEHAVGAGVVSDHPLDLLGQAHHRGPVLIAWDTARNQARHPERGHNVVFHEFAHHLDMLDGWVDGTPPLPDDAARRRWIEVCTDAYERLRAGDTAGGVLDGYGAVDPGEFFAVATEAFFARPRALARARPDLYDVLAAFYRQDPVALQRARPA